MMKIGKYDVSLLYNANAHFNLKEKLGGDPFAQLFPQDEDGKAIPMDAERFDRICTAIAEMSVQNELWRRTEGYDQEDIPSLSYIRTHLKYTQVSEAIAAIMDAMVEGMKQENEPEEVDLGLVELQKKTEE